FAKRCVCRKIFTCSILTDVSPNIYAKPAKFLPPFLKNFWFLHFFGDILTNVAESISSLTVWLVICVRMVMKRRTGIQ
ncbi:hypothetical protein, partial [Geobacillus jurassicus]|uniref:hypothetical protein n=1 Tax=Geobacillus jurassicus TaxID=235932 RepID=UPI001C3F38F7